MADATNMSRVLDIVTAAAGRGRVVLVSSAISGCTDALIEIGACRDTERREGLISDLQKRHEAIVARLFTGQERRSCSGELAYIFDQLRAASGFPVETFGELFSTTIMARKLACEDVPVLWLDSRSLVTTEAGKVNTKETYRRISQAVDSHPQVRVFVAPGFIASDEKGTPTTLGRGGSDYSAALFAAALKADVFEIWTDVPGIMTANPKEVPSAHSVPSMSYASALDMASHGAKVLYAPTVAPVMERGIPFSIRNTFDPRHPGTVVSAAVEDGVESWKGVASSQGAGESVLCLVGEGIKSTEAVSRRISAALSEAGIREAGAITLTEAVNFLIPVRTQVLREALAAVHREFFEDSTPAVTDIYVAGYGAVGHALLEMVERSAGRIARRLGRRIRVAGLSDSCHYVINTSGIEPSEAGGHLASGTEASGGAFVDAVLEVAGRKSVFVDCTDSVDLHERYPELLRRGISVVTSNRRSVAVPFAQYAMYKELALENGVFFRYDTAVGAALPILESVAGEANCSDRIVRVEALVSCTLNHILTHYNGAKAKPMATLLREAQESGLTEKDPRADIGGQDALRKLLIIGREAGIPLEASDVLITPMLGPEFFEGDLESFYAKLENHEPEFVQREADLDSRGLRQRFIASIERDPAARTGYKAEIKMQEVDRESPFFAIKGSENVTVITSEYAAPLVIKGAGEGADLAASGLIKNILG